LEYSISFLSLISNSTGAEVTQTISTAESPGRCMPLMKISLSLLMSLLVFLAYAQEKPNFTITLSGRANNGESLEVLDTVFLNSTFTKTDKIYTSIRTSDTSFVIADVSIGKHLLLFSTSSFCIFPLQIVVCSKCDNRFFFYATPRNQGDNCNVFESVELEVGYKDGNKGLARDFLSTLSHKEKRQLKESSDFSVHFYVTKTKTISDISITSSSLSQELKNIILKGLMNARQWAPAILNGRVSDEEFVLNKEVLF
jgi:hypothetical protein